MTEHQLWQNIVFWLFLLIALATPAALVYLIVRDLTKKPNPPKKEEEQEKTHDEYDEPPLY